MISENFKYIVSKGHFYVLSARPPINIVFALFGPKYVYLIE